MPAAVPVPPKKEFDILVNLRDRHGNDIGENHYAFHIINSVPFYERPIGSGNLFEPNGEPWGRLVNRKTLELEEGAKHVAFKEPQTESEEIVAELHSKRDENEMLRKEIAALKAEAAVKAVVIPDEAPKAAPKPATTGKYAAHAADKDT